MRLITLLILSFLAIQSNAQQFIGESVEYDPTNNRFFCSADNTSIVQRSASGQLSYFGSNLQADFGMEVMNNILFVSTGNAIKGYDLSSETEVMSLDIPGSGFLNGLANDGVSKLWATDFSTKSIYEINVSDLSNPTFDLVASTPNTPNGIYYDGDEARLLFVSWNDGWIRALSIEDYSIAEIYDTGTQNLDGIDEDNQGNYYVSSWSPQQITKYNDLFTETEIIPVAGLTNPADICYAKAIDTLAIPSTSTEVIFVGFDMQTSVKPEIIFEGTINVNPNPILDFAELSFTSVDAIRNGSYRITDSSGKILTEAKLGQLDNEGVFSTTLDATNFQMGFYYVSLFAGKKLIRTQKLVKI